MTLKEIYEEAVKQSKENYTVWYWMDNGEGCYEVQDYEFDDETKTVTLYY